MKILRSPWILRAAVALAGGACMAPGCNGDVLSDSTFRLWCGQTLCDWRLDAGHVARVPTWHPDDYGVELSDAPTQISQETGEGSDCMEFSAIADVDVTSRVTVQVDYNLDGVADATFPIAESGFRPTRQLIYGPAFAQRLRFIVRKDGPGRAVLAEIRLQRVTSCAGARVALANLGVGDACGVDAECTSGICCPASSFGKVCSTCCDAAPERACPPGRACGLPSADVGDARVYTALPALCDPGRGLGRAGEPCIAAADCASQACVGVTFLRASECPKAGASSCAIDRVRAGKCQ